MEIIKIGNDSMKISLCDKEVKKFCLDENENLERLRAGFIDLIMTAREKIDFKVAGKKLTGEMFSGKDGGCEVFVSRVEVLEAVYKDRVEEESVRKSRPISSIFSFDGIENLIVISKRLTDVRYSGQSSVYYDEERDKYIIILEDVSVKELKYAFMNEYSRGVKACMLPYIKEHYKCICKRDAIKLLSQC